MLENRLLEFPDARILSVSAAAGHVFSKPSLKQIRLLEGLGVEGDAHCGPKVKHRAHAARNPDKPNLRQVHLIQAELFAELKRLGFVVGPGDLGENITTTGIDLLSLPVDSELRLGPKAIVRLTGLRNPCRLLDEFQNGLKNALIKRGEGGEITRKAGVMGIVVQGGLVSVGDSIAVRTPAPPHHCLEPV